MEPANGAAETVEKVEREREKERENGHGGVGSKIELLAVGGEGETERAI